MKNKAVSRDDMINEQHAAAQFMLIKTEFKQLATQPDFPHFWTNVGGQRYWLKDDLDRYASRCKHVIQPDLFGDDL